MRKLMSGTPDDYKVIPEKIQESIVKFIEETFFSEILTHIQRETPVLFGTPTKTVSPEHFFNIFRHSRLFVSEQSDPT